MPGLAIFTICSNNYVSMARILLESARLHHPEAAHYLCLADRKRADPQFYPEGCTVVPAEALEIPEFDAFRFRYDVMELNTALKPFMVRYLLARGHDAVLYFDPDIEIFQPVDSVTAALRDGASFVVTPHICAPAEGSAFPDDIGIMQAGVFNLGFLGVGATPETEPLLRWWSRRLEYQCLNDQPGGIFVDQKFMDLLPGFAARLCVLRDPTLNVAYWNLSQRTLRRDGDGWRVDGQPLTFFHYSGINPWDTSRLSKYTDGFRNGAMDADLQALVERYAQRLLANGHGSVPNGSYAWGRFRSGTPITPFVRRLFREDHLVWPGDPADSFEEHLQRTAVEPWSGPFGSVVTNLMTGLHARERWLNERFSATRDEDAREFLDWMVKHAEPLVGDPRLIEPIAERFGALSLPRRQAPARRSTTEPDIDVVGYLRLALGLGEAGRLTLRALEHAGLAVRGLPTALNSNSTANDESCASLLVEEARAPIQVFSINADQIGQVITSLDGRLRPDAYRIMTPFWELSVLPDPWVEAFDLVDEVWAPTGFIQATLMRRLHKPVIRMPLMLEFTPPAPVPRQAWDLPEDAFLFFFAFDYFSFIERKNPLAVVDAFRRAFRRKPGGPRVALVLKTLNAEKVPAEKRALLERLRDDPDIILVERTLSRDDSLALIGACDAVVSLHRSEGLGLLVSEAMVLGKPVIATDYSATTELVSCSTGYPVDYRLIPVAPGEYPFHENQRWADPDLDHAAWQMRAVVEGGRTVAGRVAAARAHIASRYGAHAVARRQLDRLRLTGLCP